jgi:hypothetical protein
MREEDLTKPIVWHLCGRLKRKSKILVHEKVQNKNYQTTDLLIVHSQNPPNWDKYIIEVVEVESVLDRAIYNENHGVSQLRKYAGNRKYLGIPYSAYKRSAEKVIERECGSAGYGLLVVHKDGGVEQKCNPVFKACNLEEYPHALDRWKSLVNLKRIKFWWIKNRSILYSWRGSEWQNRLREICLKCC